MKARIVFSIVGTLVLVVGLIALGTYVYNLGVTSGLEETGEVPIGHHHFWPFSSVLGPIFAVIGLMILLKFALPLIFFPLFGIGFMGARWRRYRCGPRHWKHMDWEDGVPPVVRSWHEHMHDVDESDESPAVE